MFEGFKVGLALGGGAARGLAHVGVLKALEEGEIPIDLIVGTSIGALVGGVYATTRSAAATARGEEVLMQTGSLRRAVSGSSAVPGLLPPVPLDGRLLIDGGWMSKVPVIPALRLGADLVIAVDVSKEIEDTSGFRNGLNIMVRANALKAEALKDMQC